VIDINLILKTDSYKASHYLQYPPEAEGYFGYIMPREDKKTDVVFFGLQIFLMDVLSHNICQDDIDEAEVFLKKHGLPFNKDGWEYILKKYDGYIPVTINAVPEGTVVPSNNVLVTIECTDPKCFWVASHIETMLLRAVWYPTTVATYSRNCKKIIQFYLAVSSDNQYKEIQFKLHDFGARGVSSGESAAIGGAAHLVNFMGSDTIEGIQLANRIYDIDMASFSIPASEHSTITAWGQGNEAQAYENMIDKFPTMFACVSDSYDIYNACANIWGDKLASKVKKHGNIVIRPDSGNPAETVLTCLKLLDCSNLGSTKNSKGYKVINHVKLIQGDGINIKTINEICEVVTKNGFSMDSVGFGMGGALLQHHNRDELKFAMKMSAVRINGLWKDVVKTPIGDRFKHSLAGRVSLYKIDEKFITKRYDGEMNNVLRVVYRNGYVLNKSKFTQIRKRAE